MVQLLGVDLGTSSVKVLRVSETGRILGQGSIEYSIRQPRPGWAEQRPQDWWQATAMATRQALAGLDDDPHAIAAIGLSGQMHGAVLLDRHRQPLAPAIIWPDQRSQAQVEEMTALIGPERLIELSGSPVATGFQAASLRWLQQNRPDLWSQVASVLLPKDYLRLCLGGDLSTDPSDGSGTLLFDLHRRDWSPEILAALAVDPARLPAVRDSTAVAGQLSHEAAEALGLPAGIPLITGAADTAASMLAAGVLGGETLLVTISTGGQIIRPVAAVQLDRKGRSHTFCSAVRPGSGRAGWYQMAAILSAGLALRWLRDRLFDLSGEEGYRQMTAWAETVPAGAGGLIFLPYLIGERTPHMDPQARGLFLGLTARHGRAELVRAVLEGVALACYDAYSVLAEAGPAPDRIVMAGGGGRSRLWQQVIADLFGLPVQQLAVAEQSALGAALLAGAGAGVFELVETAQSWATYGAPVEPEPQRHALYQGLLPLFRGAYQKHREDFRQLQAL